MITFSKVRAADLSSLLAHYESGDYYSEDQKVVAVAHGELCLALGLKEGQELTASQVKNILEGLRPDTRPGRKVRPVGDYLTKRLRIDRIAAIDFTVSAPKDMSLLRALTGDERILDLHRSANKAAMEQAQRLICCGRRDRGNHQRSGEGFWIEYRHDVSRALDPDTHSHNLLVNIARDSGGRLVAAEIQELTAAEHIAAMRRIYWSHMAAGIRSLGYDIEMREVGGEVKVDHNGRPSVIKGGWTLKNGGTCDRIARVEGTGESIPGIKGVPDTLANLFSSRSGERDRAILIELARRQQVIETYDGPMEGRKEWLKSQGEKWSDWTGRTLSHAEVSLEVRESRDRKLTEISTNQILDEQLGRIKRSNLTADLEELKRLAAQALNRTVLLDCDVAPADCVRYAKAHSFARKTVALDYELLRHALDYGIPKGVSPTEVATALNADSDLWRAPRTSEVTTLLSIAEEKGLCRAVAGGIGRAKPLRPNFIPATELSADQREVVKFCLTCPDTIFGVRGIAGSGKSFALQEVIRALSETYSVAIIAPTTGAVTALSEDGLPALTLASFTLKDGEQPGQGAVVICDEAGLVSCRQMRELFHLAEVNDWRVILVGDTGQHAAVERGDALYILESEFRGDSTPLLAQGVLNEIRRQTDPELKNAIKDLADHRISEGFDKIDRLGCIQEIPDTDDLIDAAARQYIDWLEQSRSFANRRPPLKLGAYSPVWTENFEFTDRVRQILIERRLLGVESRTFPTYRALGWTDAQKSNPELVRQIPTGTVLHIQKTVKHLGFSQGSAYEVMPLLSSDKEDEVRLCPPSGKEFTVHVEAFAKASTDWTPAGHHDLEVRAGDMLLIRANTLAERYPADGVNAVKSKLNNGAVVEVQGFDTKGRIQLTDGRTLPSSFRQFQHGYAITSHAAQGKTVDRALLLCGKRGSSVASAKQFYVCCSRAKEQLVVFTLDKERLRIAAGRSGRRKTALELLNEAAEFRRAHPISPEESALDCWRQINPSKTSGAKKEASHRHLTALALARILGLYESVATWVIDWTINAWRAVQSALEANRKLAEEDQDLIALETMRKPNDEHPKPDRSDNMSI